MQNQSLIFFSPGCFGIEIFLVKGKSKDYSIQRRYFLKQLLRKGLCFDWLKNCLCFEFAQLENHEMVGKLVPEIESRNSGDHEF